MVLPKLYLGPMSLNTIDSIIEHSNDNQIPLGIVASRRQIEYDGGYVGLTTSELCDYVRQRSDAVVCVRDHGGPLQGEISDDGFESLSHDASHMDMIHIDVWKAYPGLDDAVKKTIEYITFCHEHNPNCTFEIGTEQALRELSGKELDLFITDVKEGLGDMFSLVKYAVIQSGTALQEGINTGVYDSSKLQKMIEICKKHGLKSKEHNGDYLETGLIRIKFDLGLDAINIAPEFGTIESRCIIRRLEREYPHEFLAFFKLCLESRRWVKWVGEDFRPEENKDKLLEICGHYVFSTPEFKSIKSRLDGIDEQIKSAIKTRIIEVVGGKGS